MTITNALLEILMPVVATVVSAIAIPALIAWLRKNNIVADESRARLLQSALENAAMIAVAKAGGTAIASGSVMPAAARVAVDYVRQSVPQTVEKLGLDDGTIADLVAPHIERALRSPA